MSTQSPGLISVPTPEIWSTMTDIARKPAGVSIWVVVPPPLIR